MIKKVLSKIFRKIDYLRYLSSNEEPPHLYQDLKQVIADNNSWGNLHKVSIEKIRAWGGRRLSINPFIKVLNNYNDFSLEALEFYKNVTDHYASYDGLHHKIEKYGFPWDITIQGPSDSKSIIQKELKSYGIALNPSQEDRMRAEMLRLFDINQSIKKSGYDSFRGHANPLIGDLLCKDDDYVVLIRQGEHRVASLYLAGYKFIPILLSRSRLFYFDPKKVNFKNSYYSNDETLKISDLIFEGSDDAPLVNIRGYFF